MNWTECEKAIHQIVLEAAEDNGLREDLNAFTSQVESELASWIDSNFGLEADPNLPTRVWSPEPP